MKTFIVGLTLVAALAVTLLNTGCERAEAAPVAGQSCTVQFRRDALGAAANLPISPLIAGLNGAQTSITGKYRRTIDEWVVLDREGREVWVPRSVILLIHFE